MQLSGDIDPDTRAEHGVVKIKKGSGCDELQRSVDWVRML